MFCILSFYGTFQDSSGAAKLAFFLDETRKRRSQYLEVTSRNSIIQDKTYILREPEEKDRIQLELFVFNIRDDSQHKTNCSLLPVSSILVREP